MASLSADALSTLCLNEISTWNVQEEASDLMIPIIGNLYRRNNVVVTLFGKGLVHQNSIDIIKTHSFVCKHIGKEMHPADTLPVLQVVEEINKLSAMRLDLGRTYLLVCGETKSKKPTREDITRVLRSLILRQVSPKKPLTLEKPTDIVLYGFGRIGRLLARLLIEKSGSGAKMMLRGIVVRKGSKEDLQKRASLLRRDSVHGAFHGTITFNEEANAFIANGNVIQVIYSDGPDKCDYTKYGISDAVVIDNTGIWRDEAGLIAPFAVAGRGQGRAHGAAERQRQDDRRWRQRRAKSRPTTRFIAARRARRTPLRRSSLRSTPSTALTKVTSRRSIRSRTTKT